MIIISIIFLVAVIIYIFLPAQSNSNSYKKQVWYDTYYDKLLHDERWINKRNEILKRDNYKCSYCGYPHKLQIHHLLYYKYPNDKFVKPWDYPNDKLRTLCDRCHKEQHKKVKTKIYYVPYDYNTLTYKSKYNSNINEINNKTKYDNRNC